MSRDWKIKLSNLEGLFEANLPFIPTIKSHIVFKKQQYLVKYVKYILDEKEVIIGIGFD